MPKPSLTSGKRGRVPQLPSTAPAVPPNPQVLLPSLEEAIRSAPSIDLKFNQPLSVLVERFVGSYQNAQWLEQHGHPEAAERWLRFCGVLGSKVGDIVSMQIAYDRVGAMYEEGIQHSKRRLEAAVQLYGKNPVPVKTPPTDTPDTPTQGTDTPTQQKPYWLEEDDQ